MVGMDVLSINNLVFSYEENIPVINNVSMTIERGELVSIVGHNGSGKSTLSKLIIGLYEADSGSINVLDMPLNRENVNAIRQAVGIVFQNPDNQFVGSTVEDDIAFGLENRNIPYNEMHKIVESYAEKVGMSDYLDSEPSALSGGQKQRVALAGVLALAPKILILDEATSMLDPRGKREILELIEATRKEHPDITIISITHDVEEAYNSDKVFVMDHGQIVLSGTPDEVFKNESAIKALGLDQPFIYKLKNEFTKYGIDISDAKDIDEAVEILCQ